MSLEPAHVACCRDHTRSLCDQRIDTPERATPVSACPTCLTLAFGGDCPFGGECA